MIRVRGLTHRFAGREVLKGISLDVEKGETVAVMGGSGEGKTTLLRCMSALLRPTEGVVELFGVDLYRASESEVVQIRRRIGVVFQNAALFDYLSVRDNVAFGVLRQRGFERGKADQLVRARLEMVGLSDTEALMPSELSGGMRKRVGLARALATDPEILFYDEPTSGLDPITAYSIDGLIREINQKANTTSVVVTHDLNSVLRVADRVVFLHEGCVIADTDPESFQASDDPRIREAVDKAAAERLVKGKQ